MATKIKCPKCGRESELEYIWIIHDLDTNAMWCEYDGATARKITDDMIKSTGHDVRCMTIHEY